MKGFSLLELMIIVAILGVLSAIAYPQYQHYKERTAVKETTEQVIDDYSDNAIFGEKP